MKRGKSILQNDLSECLICRARQGIEIHEVFYGTANRKKSIKWGLYVGLCYQHHRGQPNGVHFNKALNEKLRKFAQRKFEELHGHEAFMQEFHKNYL